METNFSILYFFTFISIISSVVPRPGIGIKSLASPLDRLGGIKFVNADTGILNDFDDILKAAKDKRKFILFLTHLGDLTSWELGQKISYFLPALEKSNTQVIAVAPATIQNSNLFEKFTKFPKKLLYLDERAESFAAMNFKRGVIPDAPLSPYFKLLLMLAGIGSDGTMKEVLRGYFGDRFTPTRNNWIAETLRIVSQDRFDAVGENRYLRPFELATVRLQNMLDIIPNWNSLIPQDSRLITQLGGGYLLDFNNEILYSHVDTGILNYTDIDKVLDLIGVD